MRAELTALRRHFHAHPELSLEETGTAAYVEDYLQKLGLNPQRVGLGVTATVFSKHPAAKTAAIRAEMDAIAVAEQTGLPWASRNPGVMHACGHDAILATALVLAKFCAEHAENLGVNVKFLFQPAEENGKGTQLMLDAGVMEGVDYFLMFHFVNDAPSGVELTRGSSSATIGAVELTVHGKASHWCTSELGVDAIGAAGKILGLIENLNRTYPASAPFILGIGTIAGGTAKNVMADRVRLEGGLRASRKEDYFALRSLLLQGLQEVERNTGVKIDAFVEDNPIPPIVNDDALVDLGLETGRRIWGDDCRLNTKQFLSGDSASNYFDHAKGIFAVFTAAKAGEENYPLHNGRFDIDEAVMEKAVEFLFDFLKNLPE